MEEIKLHKKGGYGFVRYGTHQDAVKAIAATNSKVMYGRVSQAGAPSWWLGGLGRQGLVVG